MGGGYKSMLTLADHTYRRSFRGAQVNVFPTWYNTTFVQFAQSEEGCSSIVRNKAQPHLLTVVLGRAYRPVFTMSNALDVVEETIFEVLNVPDAVMPSGVDQISTSSAPIAAQAIVGQPPVDLQMSEEVQPLPENAQGSTEH
jgi:hypothetical protein